MSDAPRRLPTNRDALRDIVQGGGVKYREDRRSYVFECPRCGKEKLHLFKDDGRFICWICKETEGFSGRPEYALTELYGMSVALLRKKLYGFEPPKGAVYLEIRLRDFWNEGEEQDPDAYELERAYWPCDFYELAHRHARRGVQYLESRGIDPRVAERYGVRYCPPQQRIIFPIQHDGVLYGWQGRSTVAAEVYDEEQDRWFRRPKVVTSTGTKKEHTLMFLDRLHGSTHAVLCEGPVDGLKADLCGGNVVTMGKAVGHQQLELLRCAGIQKVYLALDPDAAAETRRLVKELHDLETYLLAVPKPFKDLGEMDPQGVLEAFNQAPAARDRLVLYLRDHPVSAYGYHPPSRRGGPRRR